MKPLNLLRPGRRYLTRMGDHFVKTECVTNFSKQLSSSESGRDFSALSSNHLSSSRDLPTQSESGGTNVSSRGFWNEPRASSLRMERSRSFTAGRRARGRNALRSEPHRPEAGGEAHSAGSWRALTTSSSEGKRSFPSGFVAGEGKHPDMRRIASENDANMPRSSQHADVAPMEEIFERNRKWAEQQKEADPDFFNRLAQDQNPQYLWIGCSDSRVPANQILGLNPGEVFVHRNIANMVVNNDLNLLAVLQYAVEYLKVKHIFVCGHYNCGGIKAAMQNADHGDGILDSWIRNIRDVMRLHSSYLDSILDPADIEKRLVELNTIEQAINLFKTGIVQRNRLKTSADPESPFPYPRIHAVVYDPADGLLKALPTNWKQYLRKYQHIYDLYESHKHPGMYSPDMYNYSVGEIGDKQRRERRELVPEDYPLPY